MLSLATRCLRTSAVRLVLHKHKTILAPASSRLFSLKPTPTTMTTTASDLVETEMEVKPPDEIRQDLALSIQNATFMYIQHGLGGQRLAQISKEDRTVDNLVSRWQRMMEAFFGTQVHVLAGLGYPPTEKGLGLYNEQLARMLQRADPVMQERFRLLGRDLWRLILKTTFTLDPDDIPELSIVDARNIMHRIAEKMQDENTLRIVEEKAAAIPQSDNPLLNQAYKHQILQEVMVSEVYLGGDPSVVEECGFGSGEEGYLKLQYAMADHQGDPLVAQYIGSGMVKLLQAAGVDMDAIQGGGGVAPP